MSEPQSDQQLPRKLVTLECEIGHNTEAFVTSSDRVRYVIIALTVVSILVFVGHYNSLEHSWLNSRLGLARLALHEKVWEEAPGKKMSAEEELARDWFSKRRFRGEEDLEEHIKTLEEARTEHVLLMQMPVFGISYDVNDLGFFGSISLVILMLMLTFAMSRQHQNLYLALWKVRDAWRAEACADARSSTANLMYHSLAMSQHFSSPPTLARWRSRRMRSLSHFLLLLPITVQTIGFIHDIRTREFGFLLNRQGTIVSLAFQSTVLFLILLLTIVCYLYMRSSDKRWEYTFLRINERLRHKKHPSWLVWIQLRQRVEGSFSDPQKHQEL